MAGAVGKTPNPPVRRRRALLVVAVAILVVLAGAAAYSVFRAPAPSASGSGPNPSQPGEISLLPSVGTKSSCIIGTPGVPRPTLALQNGTLQANTYSVPTGTTGHVGMCYSADNGSLFNYANWTKVGATGGWFSYPQVAYGVDDYAGSSTTYTNMSPYWTLPQTVATVVNESLWVTSNYSLRAPSASDVDGYDLSFDNFFSQGLPPRFEVGPFVEVEIFLAHNISYPFVWTNWSSNTLVNQTLSPQPWSVGYWCHGTDNGSNANISFDFSFGGQSTHGQALGTIGLNLSAVLVEVEALVSTASCWTGPRSGFSQLFLDEQDLGSEDGALGGATFNYNWTIDRYCFHTHVSAPTALTVECGPPSLSERSIPTVGGFRGSGWLAQTSRVTSFRVR